MRLREIKKRIEKYNNIDLFLTYSNGIVSNIHKFKESIIGLSDIPTFKKNIESITSSELYATSLNFIKLEGRGGINIYQESLSLYQSINSLSSTLDGMLPMTTVESISINLYEPNDFDDLLSAMTLINKSLAQIIVHEKIAGELNINNWEHGSYWFDLSLKSGAAVALVSSILWSSAVISKKFTENKILEEQLRSMKIKNDSLADVLEAQKSTVSLLLDAEVDYIYDHHIGGEKDHEYIKRLKYSVNNFVELIDKGVKVYPSLMVPENVSNLFPDFNNISTIESKTKQIENN